MIRFFYKKIIKPILFKFPADDIHVFFLRKGKSFGDIKFIKNIFYRIFDYKDPILQTKVVGLDFVNPVGLAAGFDYNADLIELLPSIGFGFHTIGTVTSLPYEGNPKPMLGRLPKSKSLLVNKGFKNNGINYVLKKIGKKRENNIPLGLSIGSTNMVYKKIEDMAEDIFFSFEKAIESNIFDYFELNISCPNLINVENLKEKLDDPVGFAILLNKLSYLNINKPLFIKMYSEKTAEETISLLEVAKDYKWITGVIISNLVKDRNNKYFHKDEIKKAGNGNFSGKPTEELSNNLISEIYKKYKDRFIIIGCGGIFTGKDAYEKIKRGSSLVQMLTGMIYEGPSVIGKINKELSYLLKKDGYKSINEAVGEYYK